MSIRLFEKIYQASLQEDRDMIPECESCGKRISPRILLDNNGLCNGCHNELYPKVEYEKTDKFGNELDSGGRIQCINCSRWYEPEKLKGVEKGRPRCFGGHGCHTSFKDKLELM